ncbi:hypothetical protein MHL31_00280 [Lutibacter sp. A80]|uniref:hypothetical protein n=1 Tax=Lutibacter sp. A80 TaxID=2918453 RepID=UPI001F059A9B|nr:hypothetical protein [Lutibacter sp. A80]UMB60664.1 hypothetical protein MHL31_00280 [Lutibacter sp. A80]
MKNKKRRSLLLGSIIILIIISTPYLLYIYRAIPDELETYDTIFGTLKGGYYIKVQSFVYTFLGKFVPFLLLIIWFITNKHWWVHSLIIPISVYLFQLIAVVNDSEEFVDEVEFIYTVPIAVIIMTILYFLRGKMSIYIQAIDLKKEMEENMKFPKKEN